MSDLHTAALMAQSFARLALYSLDRPDNEALAKRVEDAEEQLRSYLMTRVLCQAIQQ